MCEPYHSHYPSCEIKPKIVFNFLCILQCVSHSHYPSCEIKPRIVLNFLCYHFRADSRMTPLWPPPEPCTAPVRRLGALRTSYVFDFNLFQTVWPCRENALIMNNPLSARNLKHLAASTDTQNELSRRESTTTRTNDNSTTTS
jgi:hypothetical protein